MKTSIKNLFAVALTMVVFTGSAFAAEVKESVKDISTNQKVTILAAVKNINKIVVNGNVEVFVVQAPTESVKVYDSYYSKNALVQQQDGVLRISSFEKEPLTVTVYVRNLSAIEAADQATVKTVGKVNFLSLDVLLKDKASADINANTVSLNTTVKDAASLKLSGSTAEHYAVMGSAAKMSMGQFVADCSDVKSLAPVYSQAKVAPQTLETLATADELLAK
ncbi:GIN domain-containing protein [Pedobacter sp. ASV28]|uniref:GIN domain-containing protein n=1 Tax=Pedobacter sp. ASV28 TaxID=2795123 RepID=UPI0018EC0A40|nr:DUF2807 domain-containing protein [Pedobacter sp. ASV28]